MTTHTEAELHAMPLEELKKLVEAEVAAAPVVADPTPSTEQPRDASGKFVVATPVADPAPVVEAPKVFRSTIDIGDGAGLQVFEADSEAGLRGKLEQALWHANKKIREDNKRAKEAPVTEISSLSPDEEYVLAQTLMTNPSKVIRTEIERQFGMPVEDVKTALAAHKQAEISRQNDAVAAAWATSTPDYYADDSNGKKMVAYINKFYAGQATAENLTAAFQDLNSSGLLKAKPVAAPPADPAPAPAAPAPPARRSSGISSLPTVPPPVSSEPSTEELYNMPLEKLAALANKQARGL
jgi:hypothetical protein